MTENLTKMAKLERESNDTVLKAPEEDRQISLLASRGHGVALPLTTPTPTPAAPPLVYSLREATWRPNSSRHPLGKSGDKQQKFLSHKSREMPHWDSGCHVPSPEPMPVKEEVNELSSRDSAD